MDVLDLIRKNLIWLAYFSLISGIFLMVWPYLRVLILSKRISHSIFYIKESRIKKKLRIINGPLSEHIEHKLKIVCPKYKDDYLLFFYLSSALCLVLGFLIIGRGVSLTVSIMFCLIMLMLPYGIVLVKLRLLQVSASLEGDVMVNELLANYSMSYNNMHEAIEKTGLALVDSPTSRRLLLQLSSRLQKTGDPEEIEKILGYFRESIATSWAYVLSMNIILSLTSGVNVETSLRDLNKSITDAKKIGEYRRRQNNESMWMLKYLAPSCYIFTVWISIKYFGFTPGKFISYQFHNSLGLKWFCIIVSLYMLSSFITVFLVKKRMDI